MARTLAVEGLLVEQIRTIQFHETPKRWASDEDIKLIVNKLTSDENLEREVGILGFKLSKKKMEIVRKKLKAKAKRLQTKREKEAKARQKAFEDAFQAAINEIVPACVGCTNGTQLKAEISYSLPERTRPVEFGPERFGLPQTIYSIDFLYCPSCGLMYYKAKELAELTRRYQAGEFSEKPFRELIDRGHHL